MLRSLNFSLILWFFSNFYYAQVKDAGFWLSGNLEKNISGLFTVNFNPQLRLNENFTELGTYFFDTGLGYELPKINLKFSANYRFSQKRNLENTYNARHRFYCDANYKLRKKKFQFTYRFRYQHQFKDINKSADWQDPSNYLRNKFAIKFKPEKTVRPFVFMDTWFRISTPIREFDNIRLGFGLDIEIDKYQSLSPSIFMDKEFNVSNPFTNFIIGLDYSFSF